MMRPDDFSRLPESVSPDPMRFWSGWPAALLVGVATLGVLALAATAWLLVTLVMSVTE